MEDNLIEFDIALERIGGDREFLIELLNELVKQIDENMEQLRNAVATSDFDNIKSVAHGIKGASANLNVTRLATYCAQLEDMGKNQSLAGTDELLNNIELSKQDLVQFLKTL